MSLVSWSTCSSVASARPSIFVVRFSLDFLQAGEFLVELGLEVGLDARFFGLEFLDFCGEFVEDGLRFVFELGDFLVHFGRSESKICDSFDPIFSNSAVKDSGLTVEKFIR